MVTPIRYKQAVNRPRHFFYEDPIPPSQTTALTNTDTSLNNTPDDPLPREIEYQKLDYNQAKENKPTQ